MAYYTTVKAVSQKGTPVKVEVKCGGKSRGFTNEKTGEISFDMSSDDNYDVYIKSSIYGEGKGKVKGGGMVTIRLS
jgi:hypothetical protein